MKYSRTLSLLVAGLLLPGVIWAHHCIRAEYDQAQLAEYSVAIEKVSWVNPHVVFTGKVVQPNGTTEMWEFEANPPNLMQRSGFAPGSVKSGDRLKIAAYRARSGARKGEVSRITFADGHGFENRFSWDGWCKIPM